MKDPHKVKMAYQLILGREPESDNLLHMEFDNVYELRERFMLSPEFLNDVINFEAKTVNTKRTKIIRNFAQYDEFVNKYANNEFNGLSEREFWGSYQLDFMAFVKSFGNPPPKNCDPFSDEYRNWEMSFFEFLSGKKYSLESEGLNSQRYNILSPMILNDINYKVYYSRLYTDFVDIAKLIPGGGDHVLEMGSGCGNLVEFLSQWGCKVTGLEVSKDSYDFIKKRLSLKNIDASIIYGSFFDIENYKDIFDVVVFEACFHHCSEPVRLMEMLYRKTSPNCKIFFMNEPIIPSFERPWGVVRFDGETVLQIRMRGWLEFGYRLDFFEQLLQRTGFKLHNSYLLHNNIGLLEIKKII
jgi:SAM-dependent methyltransferase